MKFVHMADMHFDAIFSNLAPDLAKMRRLEQRQAFKKIIEYIQKNDIEYFFISGDLYEDSYIKRTTIEYINNLFKQIPHTKVYISPGNHDPYTSKSMYKTFEWNNNVKIFSSNIEVISHDNVDIYGVGFEDFSSQTLGIENITIKNKDKLNILVTHGSLDSSMDENYAIYNPLKKQMLRDIGFDYIALGHIHKPDYSDEIVYPGSTIAMGFDELGKHGIISGIIEKSHLEIQFIPIDIRQFEEIYIDVTSILSQEDLIEKVNRLIIKEENLYKLVLIGLRNFEININEINKFIIKANIIRIKDKTKLNYDINKLANDLTLKGLFVKHILEEMEKSNYSKEELEKVLEIGLNIL